MESFIPEKSEDCHGWASKPDLYKELQGTKELLEIATRAIPDREQLADGTII